ncbi:hypothetical protein JTB14_016691 [Gonioctena quinquepunctata]|nr:hypothetical protein JTB14_016691 [Gonioctena quinquepunctata]
MTRWRRQNLLKEPASDENSSEEKLDEKTKPEQLKEDIPALKSVDPVVPNVYQQVVPAQEAEEVVPLPSESPEKPLALPALVATEKPTEDAPIEAAVETKEETPLPSEQTVQVVPATQEKVPELKTIGIPSTPVQAEPVAALQPSQKPTTFQRKTPAKPRRSTNQEAQLNQDKPVEVETKKPEDKLEEASAKPVEEPKPKEEVKLDSKAEEVKPEQQEKLPEPSASSS